MARDDGDRADQTVDLESFADADHDGGNGTGGTVDNDESEAGDDSSSADADRLDPDAVVRDPPGRPRADTVELGVELLARLGEETLPLPDAVDRVETVTTDPALVREILDTADTRGVIDRDGATVRRRTRGPTISLDRRIVRREGDYDCRRCGKSLSTGHFVQFDTGEVGPFGSSCVQKVTGRD